MHGKRIELVHHNTLAELKAFRTKSKKSSEITHANIIILMESDSISSYRASKRLKISPERARQVLISYNKNGLEGLKDKRCTNKRADAFINDELLRQIDENLSKECIYGGLWNGKKLQKWVHENYQRLVAISTIYRWMHTLNYSPKVPRPKHYKSNPEEKEKFKKNNL